MVVRSRLVHSFWFATILLALLGLSAPAFAAAHGQFVPLPSVGLPTTGDVSQVAVNASGELFATVYGDGVYRSTDGGASWAGAELLAAGSRWAWRRWRAEVELAPGPHELVVRAWDTAANRQPADHQVGGVHDGTGLEDRKSVV